ncbi:MAG: sporulation initiation factor Spo0A C-terminal domain-containing protein [Clostridia bacterium]
MSRLRDCIGRYLIELGFVPKCTAYSFMLRTLEICVTSIDVQMLSLQYLMAIVGDYYRTSTPTVLKSICVSVTAVWEKKTPLLSRIFPNTYSSKYSPQPADFLSHIVVFLYSTYMYEYVMNGGKSPVSNVSSVEHQI